ncbi:hypothetical protein [Grimontia hollisae]|nr:hypothetical protein [Grimontia hollisae]
MTGLKERIAQGDTLPLGADLNPAAPDYEKHLSPGARVKRDQQCMTTEDCYDNHDLYLNYLRGGPGFGDPLDRDCPAIANDLNEKFVLPEFARNVYGAVIHQDENNLWTVDEAETAKNRAKIRKARLARAIPTRDWMAKERERILAQKASLPVKHMFATSFGLSQTFLNNFRTFWELPESWTLKEEDLGVPSYGSHYRMDLSRMPDVSTITLVEE